MNFAGNNRYELLFMDDEDICYSNCVSTPTQLNNIVTNKKQKKKSPTTATVVITNVTNNNSINKNGVEKTGQRKQINYGQGNESIKVIKTAKSQATENINKLVKNNKRSNNQQVQRQKKLPNNNGSSFSAVNGVLFNDNKRNNQQPNGIRSDENSSKDPDTKNRKHNIDEKLDKQSQGRGLATNICQQQPKQQQHNEVHEQNKDSRKTCGSIGRQTSTQLTTIAANTIKTTSTATTIDEVNYKMRQKNKLTRTSISRANGKSHHPQQKQSQQNDKRNSTDNKHKYKMEHHTTATSNEFNIKKNYTEVVASIEDQNKLNKSNIVKNDSDSSTENNSECKDIDNKYAEKNNVQNNEQQQQPGQQQQDRRQLSNKINEKQFEVLTLDEWQAQQKQRNKPQFNTRKAGEGEDTSQWTEMIALNNNKKMDKKGEEDFETDAANYLQRVGRQQRILDIKFNFKDRRRGDAGSNGFGNSNKSAHDFRDRGVGNNYRNHNSRRGGGSREHINNNSNNKIHNNNNCSSKCPLDTSLLPNVTFKVNDERQFPTLT